MLVLLGIAFLAGLITALSPCVLPVLPLLLAGSAASESRWRPFAIVAGLVVSFTTFTLAGAALLSALGLPEDLLRTLAIVLLFVLAASLLSERVARVLERPFLFLTRRPVARESSGFVVGLSAGLVFVPCAGPVLAAVAALAASGRGDVAGRPRDGRVLDGARDPAPRARDRKPAPHVGDAASYGRTHMFCGREPASSSGSRPWRSP